MSDSNMSDTETSGIAQLSEDEQRRLVIQEASSWVGTRYVSNADLKGVGVDCAMIMIRVFSNVGLIDYFDPRPYPPQWAVHQKAEIYLATVLKYAGEIEGPPKPADLVMFQFGHCWAHGAIVTDWPNVIHANPPGLCRHDNYLRNNQLYKRRPRFFSHWAQHGLTLE